jgi:O-antigen/teichoic acid export membrane protein
MSTRLTLNSLWMILSRFGAQGLAVVFTVFLARRLGSAGFGEYAFIAALIYVANALTTFGTDMVLIREIAAQNDLSRLPAALMIQFILSALLISTAWLLGAQIPNQSPETILALKIYILSLIPLAFFTVCTTALRGVQRMDAYALLNVISAALQVGVVLLPKISLIGLAIFWLAIQIVLAMVAGWMCFAIFPNFRHAWKPITLNLYSLVKACAPLALLTLLGMVYQRLSIYMLSTMTGAVDTGLFSAAARTVEASKTIHLAIFAALYPAMALARNELASQKELMHDIRTSRNVLLAGGIFGALILFALANPIINLLYGNGYISSAPVLRILSWTLIPFTINNYLTLSFVASNREKLVAYALAASLLGLLILNLWWIPLAGPVGSARAMLLAESIQSIILIISAQSHWFAKGKVYELPDLPR